MEIDNVTYYSVPEILKREDNILSGDEIISFLKNNPSYCMEKDGELYSYHTAIRLMNNREEYLKKVYLAGAQGLDLRYN